MNNNAEFNKIENAYLEDEATSLYNKNYFVKNMNAFALKMIKGINENRINKNDNNTWSVLFCDIDALKYINTTFGHVEADKAIRNIADIIKKCIRTNRENNDAILYPDVEESKNIPIRFGGDEFVIILPNCTKAKAQIIKERINNHLIMRGNDVKNMTLSIGIADTSEINLPYNIDTNNEETVNMFLSNLIALADKNMRAEKDIDFDSLSDAEKEKSILKALNRIVGFDLKDPSHIHILNVVSGALSNNIVSLKKNISQDEMSEKTIK